MLSLSDAVKFLKACAARAEAFFSRFIIQNNLLAAALSNLQVGKPNTGAVGSAILELLAFIEKVRAMWFMLALFRVIPMSSCLHVQSNLTSLIEHIYKKFYETYKNECPIVFNAIRSRYVDHHIGVADVEMDMNGNSVDTSAQSTPTQFVKQSAIDAEEEMYWEKETEEDEASAVPVGGFTANAGKNDLSEEEISCRTPPQPLKLVDYDDDDEHNSTSDDSTRAESNGNHEAKPEDEEEELKLPERSAKPEDDAPSFLNGSVLAHKKKKKMKMVVKSIAVPQLKSSNVHEASSPNLDEAPADSSLSSAGGAHDELTPQLIAKRKLELEEAKSAESLLKKSKTCAPVTSS